MMIQAVLAAVLALGAPRDIAPEVASGVLKYARTADEAAFMIADARSESNFLDRIARGECARWECDAHKRADGSVVHLAVGLWQAHRGIAGADWAILPGNIDAQARVAARMARFAMRQCPKDPIRGGFRVLAGVGCDRAFKTEDERVAAFDRARKLLQ